MAELSPQEAAEEAIAEKLFGSGETTTAEVKEEFEYEPDPEPVVEGDEAEPEEVEATDEPELVEFEWDGQVLQAPPAIKEALMRQSDYTQKTQEVAAQRKEIEVAIAQVQQAQEQYDFVAQMQPDILKAQQLEATAEQYHQHLKDNIDNLSSTDIEKIRFAIDETRQERDSLVKSLEAKQAEFQQAQQQSFEELLNKGTEVLKSKISTWGEDAQKAVRQYALDSGFTEAEIAGVVDPRQVEVLWKASQYDALQAGKATAVKAVQNAPTIQPKSRNPMPKDVQDKLNLRKKLKSNKLRPSDKANLIEDSLSKSPLFR